MLVIAKIMALLALLQPEGSQRVNKCLILINVDLKILKNKKIRVLQSLHMSRWVDGGGVQLARLRRPSNQHVVLRRAAFGLHGRHLHGVALSLCPPGAVQVHQTHTLFTWTGRKGTNMPKFRKMIKLKLRLQ